VKCFFETHVEELHLLPDVVIGAVGRCECEHCAEPYWGISVTLFVWSAGLYLS